MRRIILALLVVGLAVSLVPAKSPNSSKPFKLAGLHEAARVSRDVWGIAHVKANNEHDVFFLQGYVHAQDRLFEMDLNRRQASGTLAELLGPGALSSDVELRTVGLRRAAEVSLPALATRTRLAMKAYADGVNAYVARHPLPPEYGALELTTFEPWTVLDSIAVGKLLAFGLSFDLDDIDHTVKLMTYVQTGEAVGFDGTALFFQDVMRSAPFDPASTIPDATGMSAATSSEAAQPALDLDWIDPGTLGLARKYLEGARTAPMLRRSLGRDGKAGSNEWAVSGMHTDTGYPLAANDPHLALNTPSTFYPIHLQAGELDVMGSGFAGVPFVVVGQNRFISWGATVNPLDVTDVYQEQVIPDPSSPSGLSTLHMGQPEPIIPIPETFRANQVGNGVPDDLVVVPPEAGVPPATLIVPRRNMGPIVEIDMETGFALSVQFTGFGPTRELETFLIWDYATGLDDFMEGLQHFDFGSQNWVYSDVHGNIAYFTSAEMPVREDLQQMTVNGLPPYFIRNGQGGNEWLPVQNPQPGQALPCEIYPYAEMPHIINPPAGWFVNANNDPAGTTLDNDPLNQLRPGGGLYYLNPGYDGFRGGRITEILREKLAMGHKISFEEMQAIQADTVLLDAKFFVPLIVQAMDRAGEDGADPMLAAFAANEVLAEAVGRLAAWDFSTPTGIPEGYDSSDEFGELSDPSEEEIASSVAATLYSVWRGQFIRNTIDATLGMLGIPVPGSAQAMTALRNLLENFDANGGVGASGLDFFAGGGAADPADRRDVLILHSLAGALDRLAGEPFAPAFGMSANQDDYRWGLLHRIVLDHPLGGPFNIPPAGGAFPPPLDTLPGIPVDGGFSVVDASSHNARADSVNGFMYGSGPVNRFVSAWGEEGWDRTESVWPGGTSGVLGSPFFVNMLPIWLTNDTIPFLMNRNDLVKHLYSVTKFVPDRRGTMGPDPEEGSSKSAIPRKAPVRRKGWKD
jgi:penicillin amidase